MEASYLNGCEYNGCKCNEYRTGQKWDINDDTCCISNGSNILHLCSYCKVITEVNDDILTAFTLYGARDYGHVPKNGTRRDLCKRCRIEREDAFIKRFGVVRLDEFGDCC